MADITKESDCADIARTCLDRYERIDILHNNVGIGAGDRGPTQMTEEIWERIFSVNLKGAMFVCKHALPVMRGQGSGVITNISSVAAVCAVGILAYKTSKAGCTEHLSTQQLMDLVFTVGQYNLVSMALNSFGVQLDEGLPGWDV